MEYIRKLDTNTRALAQRTKHKGTKLIQFGLPFLNIDGAKCTARTSSDLKHCLSWKVSSIEYNAERIMIVIVIGWWCCVLRLRRPFLDIDIKENSNKISDSIQKLIKFDIHLINNKAIKMQNEQIAKTITRLTIRNMWVFYWIEWIECRATVTRHTLSVESRIDEGCWNSNGKSI